MMSASTDSLEHLERLVSAPLNGASVARDYNRRCAASCCPGATLDLGRRRDGVWHAVVWHVAGCLVQSAVFTFVAIAQTRPLALVGSLMGHAGCLQILVFSVFVQRSAPSALFAVVGGLAAGCAVASLVSAIGVCWLDGPADAFGVALTSLGAMDLLVTACAFAYLLYAQRRDDVYVSVT